MLEYVPLHRSERCRIGEVRCRAPRGDRSRPEATAGWELVFVRSGYFAIESDGASIGVTPNHALLFSPARPYRVLHSVDGGDECTVISVEPDALDEVAGAGSGPAPTPTSSPSVVLAPTRWLSAVSVLRAAARRGDALAVEESTAHLLVAAVPALRRVAARPLPQGRSARTAALARRVVEAMSAEPGRRLRLADLAKIAGASPVYLARVFRRETGWTLHQFLVRLRLRLALERLWNGENDLTNLALDLGFADHSHFTNAFRREFGVAPSVYRQRRGSFAPLTPLSGGR